MKKTLFATLFVKLILSPLSVFALASGSVVIDPADILENTFSYLEEAASNAYSALTSSSELSDYIKEYTLDPLATKIAQDMINRASSDTVNWINSGFQGGGPGFIVNPDAYLKNVANQEIRIQLDAVNKSLDPYKSAVSVALVKNIRTGRSSVAAQLQYTLTDTVRQETCDPKNLEKIATSQIDQGLSVPSATGNDASLSRSEKIKKRVGELNQQFCSAAAKSDPQSQVKLQACFNSGACGGWASLFDAYAPRNTISGRIADFNSGIDKAANNQRQIAQGETADGLIPEKVCQTRLQVDDEDNPYPNGEGPCVEWNIKTPVSAIKSELNKSITGDYGKLTQADELGEIIGNALLNQATQALYKGLNNSLQKTGVGTVNVSFDNFLVNNSKSLPTTVLQNPANTTVPTLPAEVQANLAKAVDYCTNMPEEKRDLLATLCKHLTSNKKAQGIDTAFKSLLDSYLRDVQSLASCITDAEGATPPPGSLSKWKDHNEQRNNALVNIDTDSLNQRVALYPKSILTLSTYIVSVVSKDSGEASTLIGSYTQNMSDSEKFVGLYQEKLSQVGYNGFKNQMKTHDSDLPQEIGECTSYMNKCRENASLGMSCTGGGPGDGGGSQQ